MSAPLPARPLVAVDIGNTRIKFGRFEGAWLAQELPAPGSVLSLAPDDLEPLADWLSEGIGPFDWFVSSVNRTGATRLHDWLRERRSDETVRVLTAADLPLTVALPSPEKVGNDRLASAVAANRLRKTDRGALVVDLGTALTVNVISPAGEFLGGAILPGLGTSAVALHEMTDLLPLVDVLSIKSPPAALGTNTQEAMLSGLYWGAVGAVRELKRVLSSAQQAPLDLFITGGYAEVIMAGLGEEARHVPHLTLSGIALSAAAMAARPAA